MFYIWAANVSTQTLTVQRGFNETTAAGEPITSYASSSPGAAAYRRLAREVISRGGTA